jgi:hypothetical protein
MGLQRIQYMPTAYKTIDLVYITLMHQQVTLYLDILASMFLHHLVTKSNISNQEHLMLLFLLINLAIILHMQE